MGKKKEPEVIPEVVYQDLTQPHQKITKWYLMKTTRRITDTPRHIVDSCMRLHCIFLGYIPAADVIGLDIYPVPRARLDLVAKQTDIARTEADGKVVSMILQFFMDGRFLREPTPEELTSMWYMSLIHGARSIGLYSRRPTALPLWDAMKKLASEIVRQVQIAW